MKQYDFVSETDENGKRVVSVANAPKRRKIDIVPMIFCFFISLFIWIYMVNLNDTDVTATFTIPIEIEGIGELQGRNNMMIYGVDTDEIVVTVKGSNRDLRRFSQSDYRAVIDVSDILQPGRHSRTVTVSVPTGSTITLDMKELVSVTFYTDVKVTKEIPFDYMQGNLITNPNYTYEIEKNADFVEVTGPQSIIDSIDSAKFRIPDDEYYTSKSFLGFQLTFLDQNGDNITYDSSVVTYSTTDVSVKIVVTMEKLIAVDVKLPTGVSGIEAKLDVDSIYVKGDPAVLSSINKHTIVLSEEDVEDVDGVVVVLTDEDLPLGVKLVSSEQTIKISLVAVSIESESSSADSSETEETTGAIESSTEDTVTGDYGDVTEEAGDNTDGELTETAHADATEVTE